MYSTDDGPRYRVYLGGPLESGVATRWREDIVSANFFADLGFVNPMEFECATNADRVEQCFNAAIETDGMLVHYEHDEALAMTAAEMTLAQKAGNPVVLWIDQYRGPREEIPAPIRNNTTEMQRHGRTSINRIMELL